MKAAKIVKSVVSQLGLRKPLLRMTSAEYREVERISAEATAGIQAQGFKDVYAKHANSADGYRKYLELDVALEATIKLFLRLGLESGPSQRILDIGCGPAYFLYLAKTHGHEVLG